MHKDLLCAVDFLIISISSSEDKKPWCNEFVVLLLVKGVFSVQKL
jgi:hypothetical protein